MAAPVVRQAAQILSAAYTNSVQENEFQEGQEEKKKTSFMQHAGTVVSFGCSEHPPCMSRSPPLRCTTLRSSAHLLLVLYLMRPR